MPKFPYVVFDYVVREDGAICGSYPLCTVYACDPWDAARLASLAYPEKHLGPGHSTWGLYWRKRAKGVPCLNSPIPDNGSN